MRSGEFRWMVIGAMLLLTTRFAAAQATGGAPSVPVLASGQASPVMPSSLEGPSNVLQLGISVGASYDDNVATQGQAPQSDIGYLIMPSILFEETRPRIAWSVSYAPGLQISQNLFYRNLFTQAFSGTVSVRTSAHGTFSAEQYYLVTENPFGGFANTEPGPVIAPNESIFIPNTRQTLSLSHALYSYRPTERTTMGFGGSFELNKYDKAEQGGPTVPLVYAHVASGEAYISHQFSARNQLGFQYEAQVMRFPQANARTTVHTFTVFDQIDLSPQTTLTLYGGPQYSLTFNQVALNLGFIVLTFPVQSNQWTGSGGVIYSWTGSRLAASVNFTRAISNGGGLIGAVEMTAGNAELSCKLTAGWSLVATVSGADNQLLAESGDLRVYSGSAGIRRRLWRNAGIRVFYQRLDQTGSINGFSLGNRNIVGATLNYSITKPLGG